MKLMIAALLLSSFATRSFAAETSEVVVAPTADVVVGTDAVAEEKVSCLLGIPDNLDAQLILTATESKFSIFRPSSDGHSGETIYDKAPIALFMAPVEAPIMECTSDVASIVVWERIALVNGQYFSLDNATAVNEN